MTGPARPSRTSRLDPNLAAALAYVGGAVTGIIFLLVENENRYVRFHAMQSAVTFLGVLIVHLILGGLPLIGWALYLPFILGVVVLWFVLMFKALRGEQYKLPYIGDWVEQQLR